MADVTVKKLADVVGIPVERLLSQLQEAGLPFEAATQTVNEEQKRILLNHIKSGSAGKADKKPETITLQRKKLSRVTLGSSNLTGAKVSPSSSGRQVTVEVRKKRTYVRREQQNVDEEQNTDVPDDLIRTEDEQISEATVATVLEANEVETHTEANAPELEEIKEEDQPAENTAVEETVKSEVVEVETLVEEKTVVEEQVVIEPDKTPEKEAVATKEKSEHKKGKKKNPA